MKGEVSVEFHDLDFGLTLPSDGSPDGEGNGVEGGRRKGTATVVTSARSNVTRRTNVAISLDGGARAHDELWRLVPGDIVMNWKPHHFDNRTSGSSDRQNVERWFYIPCTLCGRSETEMKVQKPIETCRGRSCEKSLALKVTPTLAQPSS